MALTSFLTKHATLEYYVTTDDLAGGQTGVWTALAPLAVYKTTPSSKLSFAYKREGYENVVVFQLDNNLPKRILGHKTFSDLMRDSTHNRMRFLFRGRTLYIVGFEEHSEGRPAFPMMKVICTETVPARGYVNV